mgnify:CR=1 FL=1
MNMNIVKFGGSIVNPDGKYDNSVIQEFVDLVSESEDRFIFVVGGGSICRKVQDAAQSYVNEALTQDSCRDRARDIIGIATTHINAQYVLDHFKSKLGVAVYHEVILDPTLPVKGDYKVYFTGGWKPGCSTDKDMMLLAKNFNAERVFKISDFEIVKDINPIELSKMSKDEQKKALIEAPEIPEMNWEKLVSLVGTKWDPGLSTPFDPRAAQIGYDLREKLLMYIVRKEELSKILRGEEYRGTLVKG